MSCCDRDPVEPRRPSEGPGWDAFKLGVYKYEHTLDN